MKNTDIEINIDSIMLEGVDAADKDKVIYAMQTEIERLFTDKGVPPALCKGGNIYAIDAGALKEDMGNIPSLTGQRAGQAIYGSF